MAVSIIRKGTVGGIVLDAELYERHGASSRITQYPVETGTDISDHISLEPQVVTVEGFITDSPLEGGNVPGRYLKIFDELDRLWKARVLLTVVTHLRIYQDMAIRNLDTPRDGHTGEALRFTIDFQKVVKASPRTVSVPADILAPPVGDQGQTGVDMGPQNTEWVDIPVKATWTKGILRGDRFLHDRTPQLF